MAMQKLINAVGWKMKQKYSQMRSRLGGGYYIWQLENGINFISRTGDAFSHVLYVCKGHEKVEMNWCRRWIKLGSSSQSLIDCGANIGYFSAVLAQACSLNQILAIEGNERIANLCQENLNLLGIQNVKVVQAILSDNLNDKSIIPDLPGREPWQQAVKVDAAVDAFYTNTLDNLVKEFEIAPSLVKIDCEGFETFILKGANSLLSSVRPTLMIECNDRALEQAGSSRADLFSLLQSFNYKLFCLASFRGEYTFGAECDRTFPSSEFNFAAIPNDDANLARWHQSL